MFIRRMNRLSHYWILLMSAWEWLTLVHISTLNVNQFLMTRLTLVDVSNSCTLWRLCSVGGVVLDWYTTYSVAVNGSMKKQSPVCTLSLYARRLSLHAYLLHNRHDNHASVVPRTKRDKYLWEEERLQSRIAYLRRQEHHGGMYKLKFLLGLWFHMRR